MPDSQNPSGGAEWREDLTGTSVGRFAIRSRLGAGGMGQVYRAEDTALKRQVALKRLAPRLRHDVHYRQRFLKEAERASSLTHKNIAGIYDIFEERGEPFLVMEYVEGTTLRDHPKGTLTVEEFMRIAPECALALAAAHEKRLVHRDIKPENIMLTRAGEVKILDFGVARRLPRTDPQALTDSSDPEIDQGMTGTIAYMSPEMLQSQEADGRADLFSLGIVFYEMLAGQHPFRGPTLIATTDRILHTAPPPISQLNPDVPVEVDRIVERLLAKDRSARYADATELLTDLQLFASQGKLLHAKSPKRQWRTRRVIGAVAGLILLLFLSTVALLKLRMFRSPAPAAMPVEKGLVVLPFHAIGGGPEEQAFCDGVTDTLTSKLTQLTATNELTVVPASEVRARKVTSPDSARKELGATLVLSGNLYQSGGRVRINYELVDTRTLRQLRANTITAQASDPFGVQDQVAEGAVRMLDLALGPAEQLAMVAHGTKVAAAYDLYLKGVGYLQDYDQPEKVEGAVQVFNRALKLDPNYAQAYAGLGEALWDKYELTKETQWVASARDACTQATSLAPQAAEPHVCLGTLYNGTGQYQKAVEEFQRARDDEPTMDGAYRGLASAYENLNQGQEAEKTYLSAIQLRPRYWGGYNQLGVFYFRDARFGKAEAMFEKVVQLVPDSTRGYNNLGGVYVLQGRYADAIRVFRRAAAIRPSDDVYSNLGTSYFYLRRYKEATENYQQALKLNDHSYLDWGNLGDAYYWSGEDKSKAADAFQKAISLVTKDLKVNPHNASVLGYLAYYQAMQGQRKPALDALQEALRLSPKDPELLFNAGLTYKQLGEPGQAVQELKAALAAGYSPPLIRDTPILDSLRSDPNFQKLLQRN
jgi:tetratricopeptide (TPR) repeat protein/TolB-like protein/tRNA A-37 threonylcarbamoyl transferase component Bud32